MTETPNPTPHEGHEGPDPQIPPPAPAPQYQQPAYGYAYADSGAVTQTDRNWAAAAHWGTLVAAWIAMGFLAPLIVMLTIGNQSPFVRKHAVESLNFQISLLIYFTVAVLFSLFTLLLGLIIVIPLALAAVVAVLVFLIQASIKAAHGEDYRYPLTIRLVS
jgi:uncharacterized Tic20 family protein